MIGRVFFHYAAVMCGIDEPQTQTTQAERDLLTRYLPGRKRIVEIGVFEGFTTRVLADHADSDATIYGVDPFFTGRIGVSWGLGIASAHNREHLRSGRLKFVKTLSTDVGTQAPAEVDYVFIDGDHSLDAIRVDWAFWSARLAPNGVIVLHDTLLSNGRTAEFGSHRYFRDHIRHDPRFEIVAQVDSLSVMSKTAASCRDVRATSLDASF